jgi:hypothetical protein
MAPSGGRRNIFWGISSEKSRFYAEKSYFSPEFLVMGAESWQILFLFILSFVCYMPLNMHVVNKKNPQHICSSVLPLVWIRTLFVFELRWSKKIQQSLILAASTMKSMLSWRSQNKTTGPLQEQRRTSVRGRILVTPLILHSTFQLCQNFKTVFQFVNTVPCGFVLTSPR